MLSTRYFLYTFVKFLHRLLRCIANINRVLAKSRIEFIWAGRNLRETEVVVSGATPDIPIGCQERFLTAHEDCSVRAGALTHTY